MGVTVFYRGSLDDLERIEDFEDRVVDLALELGGQVRVWRSGEKNRPGRLTRGVLPNLFPGQEPTGLLISPEGRLIGLHEVETAERGEPAEPSWCWVKTQFGPVEGHAALIELLAALRKEFISDLEVRDEGGYWETRDLAALAAKFRLVQAAIDGMAEGLRNHGLSSEAAEDPEILAARVERIAGLVHRTLARPAEHPPVGADDHGRGEAHWDDSYKENRRRQERVHRAIDEHLADGDEIDEAFDAAMHEETALGLPEDPDDEKGDWPLMPEGGSAHKGPVPFFRDWDDDDEADEPWRASLPEAISDADAADDWDDDAEDDIDHPPRHPLLQRAQDLLLRLHELLGPGEKGTVPDESAGHIDALVSGAGDVLGGLAQALGGLSRFTSGPSPFSSGGLSPFSSDENGTVPFEDEDSDPDDAAPFDESAYQPFVGISIAQLKRAQRGAVYALAALPPLRTTGTLDQSSLDELRESLEYLRSAIQAELNRLREHPAEE